MNPALRYCLCLAGILCVSPAISADAEIDALRRELAELMGKVERLEQAARHTPESEKVTPPEQDAYLQVGPARGSWLTPGSQTALRIQGFVQTDAIYDFGPRPSSRGGDVSATQSAILEGEPEYDIRGDVRINARNTRIGLFSQTPTRWGNLRTLIDADFNGPPNDKASRATTNRTVFGIRNAYAEMGNLLFGMYSTAFSDNSVFPGMVSGPGPAGQTFIRQGQLRYTWRPAPGQRLAVALENPRGDFDGADDDTLDDGLPDLAIHYRYQTERWHLQFAGMLRRIGINDGLPDGRRDTVTGWGLNQSGAFRPFDNRDRVSWYLAMGDGIGRYLAGATDQGASIDTNGDLDAQFAWGGYLTYTHWWFDNLQSNLFLGMARYDLNPEEVEDANSRLYSTHLNLIWSPHTRLRLAMEYIWGHRRVHDGRSGEINRMQMSSVMYF